MKVAWNKTTILDVNMPRWTKKMEKGMERLWKDAISVFVRTIIQNDLIHVDTGMSRATLLPLSRYVRGLTTIVRSSIHPKSKGRPKYKPPSDWPTEGDLKSIAHGQRLGEEAYTVQIGTIENPVCEFEFNIRVYQYFLHENGFAGGPAWNSLPIALEAFETFIKTSWKEYVPGVEDLFTAGGTK
jgi:hypothetical protein